VKPPGAAGSTLATGRCNTSGLDVLFLKVVFSERFGHVRLLATRSADLMRRFEARQLLLETRSAFGKAHNVIHLEGGVALTH